MKKSTGKFLTGMGIGLLVGGMAAMAGETVLRPQKEMLMGKMRKAVHKVGDMADSVEEAL